MLTPQLKQQVITGPYRLDTPAMGVHSVRGENNLIVGKFAACTINKQGVTHTSSEMQAKAGAALMFEAVKVLERTGMSPYELEKAWNQLKKVI